VSLIFSSRVGFCFRRNSEDTKAWGSAVLPVFSVVCCTVGCGVWVKLLCFVKETFDRITSECSVTWLSEVLRSIVLEGCLHLFLIHQSKCFVEWLNLKLPKNDSFFPFVNRQWFKMTVFCIIRTCGIIRLYRRFGVSSCFYIHCARVWFRWMQK
jgi:hypothetical protein